MGQRLPVAVVRSYIWGRRPEREHSFMNHDANLSVSGTPDAPTLAPHAPSRKSRRFEAPTLIFNRHAQFEVLRQEGRYETLRDRIRQRDIQLQGSINPMLKDHGEASEAIQYSGRAVEGEWRCPFAHGQEPSVKERTA